MNSKRFFYSSIAVTALLCSLFIGFNVAMNEFGLYGDVTGKQFRIWGYERATKLLFTKNYIPSNFDGVMIGPSVSDIMLDTEKLTAGKIYNLSINGGNICELKKLYDSVAERKKLDHLIISLSPYITRDCEMKTAEMNPKLSQSVLGSIFTLRFYLFKYRSLKNPEADPFVDSWWGYRLNSHAPETLDVEEAVKKTVKKGFSLDMSIAPEARFALEDILNTARAQGTKVVVFYPPMLRPLYESILPEFEAYKKEMADFTNKADAVLDFNSKRFVEFSSDYSHFHDVTHLNEKGATFVMDALNVVLKQL